MIENKDILAGAITESKLSKNLRLKFTNIVKGSSGQIPIVQSDGSMAYKTISGDASLSEDGVLTVPQTSTSVTNSPITSQDVDSALGFKNPDKGYVKRVEDNRFKIEEISPSGTVSKVTFEIDWHTSGTAIGDSARGDGVDGKITANWTSKEVTLIHDLKTKYLSVDVLDIGGDIADSPNQWLDTGVINEVLLRYVDDNTILLAFGSSATANHRFHVNIIG